MISFAYDPEGNLTEAEFPNGVTTTNAYDGAGRMTETTSVAGATTLQSFDYAYDVAGNRTSQVDRNSDTTTYAYDALNRLTEFDPPATAAVDYAYDAAGNRTEAGATTYSYDALNQLTSDSDGTDYDYDGAGRLIDATNGSDTTTYAYDALDQLTEVDDGSAPITYSYDALGRRSERTQAAATQTAHYGDLSDRAILDTDSGGIYQSFVAGPVGLVESEVGSDVEFALPDAHGDITTLTDDVGAVASRQDHDPWGAQLSGPALEMGWLGAQQRRLDPDAGLVQMGVRGYAPRLGRFVSEDPVLMGFGSGQSTNRGSYGLSDPINRFDLDGRMVSASNLCFWCPDDEEVPLVPSSSRAGATHLSHSSRECTSYGFSLSFVPGFDIKLGVDDAGGALLIEGNAGFSLGLTRSVTPGPCTGGYLTGIESCEGLPGEGHGYASERGDGRVPHDIDCFGFDLEGGGGGIGVRLPPIPVA